MKVFIYFVFFCFCVCCVSFDDSNSKNKTKEVSNSLILIKSPLKSSYSLSKDFLLLLSDFDSNEVGTLEGVLKKTQEKWLRPRGKERWESKGDDKSQLKKFVLPILTRLKMVHDIKPSKKYYDSILILGATSKRMEARINYFFQVAKDNNLKFKEVFLLSGERPLNRDVDFLESMPELLNDCQYEACAMEKIWMRDSHVNGFESVPYTLIDTKATIKEGRTLRPTTVDTVFAWLDQTNPVRSSCLAISNNPYIGYQNASIVYALKASKKSDIDVETIGDKASESTSLSLYYDSLARWFYFIFKTIKLGKTPSRLQK